MLLFFFCFCVCLEFQIIRFVINTFTPIFFIKISFVLPPPPPPSVGMRFCRSAWPGLCFFCCYQPLCVVSQQSWFGVFCFTNLPILHTPLPSPPSDHSRLCVVTSPCFSACIRTASRVRGVNIYEIVIKKTPELSFGTRVGNKGWQKTITSRGGGWPHVIVLCVTQWPG